MQFLEDPPISCFLKFGNIHRKTPLFESIFQGYNKPLTTVCWKTPIFQSKQRINSQFTVALNSIIALNSIFFSKQKDTRVFQWQVDINVIEIIALLSTKPCLSFSKFYFLAKIFEETFIEFVKSTSFPKELW